MPIKGKDMEIIISTINTITYIQILENFLNPSIENTFDYKEVCFFSNNNAPSHRVNRVKDFLQEGHTNSMR